MNDRFKDSIASHFKDDGEFLILKSPSDIGVRRNFGRNGARFAPQAIEACFKKMTHHLNGKSFKSISVSNHQDEVSDYDTAMNQSSENLKKSLYGSPNRAVHIGGGHDHALPLLKALDGTDCQNNSDY